MTSRWHESSVALPFVACLFVACLTACGSDDAKALSGAADGSSGAACPPDSTLSYENFGKAFMEKSCTHCHDSALSGPARQHAPGGYDFDTLEGIKERLEDIDQEAASGPDATNEKMPPAGAETTDGTPIPRPTREERKKLGEWLACGAE